MSNTLRHIAESSIQLRIHNAFKKDDARLLLIGDVMVTLESWPIPFTKTREHSTLKIETTFGNAKVTAIGPMRDIVVIIVDWQSIKSSEAIAREFSVKVPSEATVLKEFQRFLGSHPGINPWYDVPEGDLYPVIEKLFKENK